MTGNPSDHSDRLATATCTPAMLLVDQKRRWFQGDRVLVEVYCEQFPSLGSDSETLLDLIYGEVLLRETLGEQPMLAEYVERFPTVADQLRLQFELDQVMRSSETLAAEPENSNTDFPPTTETTSIQQPGSSLLPKLPAEFGRYHVFKLLGRGAMGAVYLAEDTQLRRQVALKLPRFDREDSPETIARFRREAQIAATFHHPNLCPVYDFGELDGTLYLTMPCLSGEPLSARLESGALPEKTAVRIALKIARAMSVAHRAGVVHRDLKPANILLREDDEPVVMDFGLARRNLDLDPKLTGSGALVGTLAYMAPEQLDPAGDEIGPVSGIL